MEVVDSSSTTPTILHQAKPLETSSFPTVFLLVDDSFADLPEEAKTVLRRFLTGKKGYNREELMR